MRIIKRIITTKALRRTTIFMFLGYALFISLGYLGSTVYFTSQLETAKDELMKDISEEMHHHIDNIITIEKLFNEENLDMTQEEFNTYMFEVYDEDLKCTLFVAPSGIVKYVYPESNIDLLINNDLISDYESLQSSEYYERIQNQELILITDKNKDEITYLYPIYVNEEFYGLSGVVLHREEINQIFSTASSSEYAFNVLANNRVIYGSFDEDRPLLGNNTVMVDEYSIELQFFKNSQTYQRELMTMFFYILIVTVFFGLSMYHAFKEFNKKIELIDQLQYQNDYNITSGLKNERRLYKDVIRIIADNNEFYVAFGSLNNIKFIFDKFGKEIGEGMVKKTATLIQRVLPKKATIYHYGGEEILIVFETKNKGEVINVLRNVTSIFNEDVIIEKARAHVSVSFGITKYPTDGKKLEELIKNAHITHARIRANARNSFGFFEKASDLQFVANQDFDDYVSKLSLNSFETYLMPVVEVDTDEIVGFECLSRVFDTFGNQLNIGSVINSFERGGRIQELDEHIFKHMISVKAILNKKYNRDISLSSNCSALSLNEDFVNRIIKIYKNAKLKYKTIILELTESYRVEDFDNMIKLFNKLDEAGIKVAIDDFGSGYSSLTYISKFNIFGIKIDKQYVRDYETNEFNRTLLKTLQSIAGVLKCSLVAEGVDSPETLEYLKEQGCRLYQGYLFSKAVSFEDALVLLDKNFKK